MKNIFEKLKERGLIAQISNKEEFEKMAGSDKKLSFYFGIDPTADSMHVGHLLPVIMSKWLIDSGNKAVALVGGGTALIGDPSGKTEMRKMLTKKDVRNNFNAIQSQAKKILGKKNVTFVDNADWLSKINYLDFLRDFGPIFKVNEMIKAETYRARLEREDGLTFLEFNYQLLQGYDFLHLYKKYNCTLQIGGDDQWSNMLAGSDLIRRKESAQAFVVTIPLLTTASGKKMGKTESGAVWLDPKKTSPFEFYQFWINTDDKDTARFLKIFTFLDDEKINELSKITGAEIRSVKKILAYEVTKFVHGENEAEKAKTESEKVFEQGKTEDITAIEINSSQNILEALADAKIAVSKSEIRRLVNAGGITINDKKISNEDLESKPNSNDLVVKVGKKKFFRIKIK